MEVAKHPSLSKICMWELQVMFVAELQVILHWSFTPVATTIFNHILGNGQCHWTPVPCGGCRCQCGLPFSFTLLPWVVM
jgi:hypothetical protein